MRARRGFTLIEVTMATVIVGVMFAAAMSTVAAARSGERSNISRRQAVLLAEDLMTEILRQPYEDADAPGALGPEAGEGTTNRLDFDDVDDYAGRKGEAQEPDGTLITWASGYERLVTVVWVEPDALDLASGVETGVKRITITVERNGKQFASMTTVRTSNWSSPVPGS